jgi:hypothetical protein
VTGAVYLSRLDVRDLMDVALGRGDCCACPEMASHIKSLVFKGRHIKSHQATSSTGRRHIKRTPSPTLKKLGKHIKGQGLGVYVRV